MIRMTKPNQSAKIHITYGTGMGENYVAAYSSALRRAGIHEFNLQEGYPIIPRNSIVRLMGEEERQELVQLGDRGDVCYGVVAKNIGMDRGRVYSAGIGWVQDREGSGFIVRYPGIVPITLYNEQDVEALIRDGIGSLQEGEGRVWDSPEGETSIWGDLELKVVSKECEGNTVAAVAVAIVKVEKL